MGRLPKTAMRESLEEQVMRDKEVMRANRELAAYFRGHRTEREARAALKIIKAYVRERERMDAKSRPPLPGKAVAAAPVEPPRPLSKKDRVRPRARVRPRQPKAEKPPAEALGQKTDERPLDREGLLPD